MSKYYVVSYQDETGSKHIGLYHSAPEAKSSVTQWIKRNNSSIVDEPVERDGDVVYGCFNSQKQENFTLTISSL